MYQPHPGRGCPLSSAGGDILVPRGRGSRLESSKQAVVAVLGWQDRADLEGLVLSRCVEQRPETKLLTLKMYFGGQRDILEGRPGHPAYTQLAGGWGWEEGWLAVT